MLFGKKHFCVLCEKYHDERNTHIFYDEIGVCNSCYQKLLTTKDKSFDCGDRIKAVFSPYFYMGDMAESVKNYKFSGQRLYGNLFGKMLFEELKGISYIWDFDTIIPVPLHQTRLDERGYNQSEIIAKEISLYSGIPVLCDGLFRIRETKRQSSLKGMERRENVRGAFCAAESVILGKRIVLVDDICTMGETLRACAEALFSAGAKEIIAITLCITYKEEERFSLY